MVPKELRMVDERSLERNSIERMARRKAMVYVIEIENQALEPRNKEQRNTNCHPGTEGGLRRS